MTDFFLFEPSWLLPSFRISFSTCGAIVRTHRIPKEFELFPVSKRVQVVRDRTDSRPLVRFRNHEGTLIYTNGRIPVAKPSASRTWRWRSGVARGGKAFAKRCGRWQPGVDRRV